MSRSADAPNLQRGFFEHWSDIDDLTGRYVAVFSPSPEKLTVSVEHPHSFYGPETIWVRGLEEAGGASSRLYLSTRASAGAVRMGQELPFGSVPQGVQEPPAAAERARLVAQASDHRPHGLEQHQRALTRTVSDMQRFFGVPSSLVPCAVIVDLEQRRTFVVALHDGLSVYDLLKRVMGRIERAVPRIDEAEAARVAALDDRCRARNRLGQLRVSADHARQDWDAHKRRLIDDLHDLSGRVGSEAAGLCCWMAERLHRDEPLTDDEWASARALLRALHAARLPGRLPRRLRRTLAGLNSGRPESDAAPRRLAQALADAEDTELRIGRAKARLDALGPELRLGQAVVDAAGELGLTPLPQPDLLTPRGLLWTPTVLARQAPGSVGRLEGWS
ncbi:hypothetical protein [Streptomyces sp. NPDC049813]|uniref:hypothetical protein n=1 Tax=Streptomyces sp. NPDC049813 TaxID=3365597 RepID=UPI00378FAB56